MTCCGQFRKTAAAPSPGGELPPGEDVGNLLQWDGGEWIPVVVPTTEGQIIAWDADTSEWIAQGAPSANGQVLVWDSAAEEWVASGGGGALPEGDDIGNILVWDGTDWVPGSIPRVYEWQALTAGNSTAVRWIHCAGSSVAASTTEVVSYREAQISGVARKLRVSLFTALATNLTIKWFLNTADTQTVTLTAGLMNAEVAFTTPVFAGDLWSIRSQTVAADANNVGIRVYLLVDTP